jgi:aconitate hydratase
MGDSRSDLVDARGPIELAEGSVDAYQLAWLAEREDVELARLPHTVKILLEGVLRRAAEGHADPTIPARLAHWPEDAPEEFPFMPARVLMQDFTGVPAVVDLAALRSAIARGGGDPTRANPVIPADLVVDHSVQVDRFGGADSYRFNLEREYERNGERYALLRWAQQGFDGMRVVPPGKGICHQVNLEYLARVVQVRDGVAMPDTLVGTDSHTTMVNGLGVLGWGVGGIEAEVALVGEALSLGAPVVVGVHLTGALRPGATATDLVLTLTERLRAHGVVGKFVEFFGTGLSKITVPDRATLSNMAPEYGATAGLFPVDENTLRYLRETNRGEIVELVERYTKAQGLFRTDDDPDPVFSELVRLDLGEVEPSLAGPRRPQDRVALAGVPASFREAFPETGDGSDAEAEAGLRDGSVVIAAITSCTNTSNPTVMVAAGLLAKKAVEAGLQPPDWVKTSLAPGSRVVTEYLDRAGLTPYLEKLGFSLVGYGCTTCIGNSGPLSEPVASEVTERELTVVAVLSGNRNFEGRIHPQVRASYLASPPLCVAYALAGTVLTDLTAEPLGHAPDGTPVFLRDLWPTELEVADTIAEAVTPEEFEREYSTVSEGDDMWSALPVPSGPVWEWAPDSTYVREPPFYDAAGAEPGPATDIEGARALLVVGDSVTTDHISPAGAIHPDSPAGRYLQEHGVAPRDFNSYGARRGNHEVMMRGTFANTRIRNRLLGDAEGPRTVHLPSGEELAVYDAAMRYAGEGTPLVVLAGKEYGSGSSRDWAAKGPLLLGIRAAIAESFERIHRSNLVAMGVLPLEYHPGESAESLGLTGRETFTIRGLAGGVTARQEATVEAVADDGTTTAFTVRVRVDGPAEAEAFRHGGVLPMVARSMLSST